ncbi:MAG TPA: hypothetical protein VF756_03515 [Thermoanaerobaculia bacterium]
MANRKTMLLWAIPVAIIVIWSASLLLLTSPAKRAMRSLPAFGEYVTEVARAKYPDRQFELVADAKAIRSADKTITIENLYEDIRSAEAGAEDIDGWIQDHLELAITGRAPAQANRRRPLAPVQTPPWEEAQGNLLPHLVSAAHAQRIQGLVHREMAPGVQVAYTIGFRDMSILLVTQEDLEVWGVGEPQLYEKALANLANATQGLRVEPTAPRDPQAKGKWAGISARDGFDSARILLPSVRQELARALGEPFYFVMPVRGFLVAWSKDFGEQQQFAQRARTDFGQQPQNATLSPEVFEGTASGFRIAAVQPAPAQAAAPAP